MFIVISSQFLGGSGAIPVFFSSISFLLPILKIHVGTHGTQEAICIWGVITRRPSRKTSENQTFILKQKSFCFKWLVHSATGRGFHRKTRIRFILIRMYKIITTFIGYTLTSLHNLKLCVHPKSNNPDRTIVGGSILQNTQTSRRDHTWLDQPSLVK